MNGLVVESFKSYPNITEPKYLIRHWFHETKLNEMTSSLPSLEKNDQLSREEFGIFPTAE